MNTLECDSMNYTMDLSNIIKRLVKRHKHTVLYNYNEGMCYLRCGLLVRMANPHVLNAEGD